MISADVARRIQALPEALELAQLFFKRFDGAGKARYAIELALEELFTNIVKYNREGAGPVRIEIDLQDGEVMLRLSDHDAPRFDPFNDAPDFDPDRPLEERTPGGVGLHLVKKMMDRIEYSHQNRTSTITVFKRVD